MFVCSAYTVYYIEEYLLFRFKMNKILCIFQYFVCEIKMKKSFSYLEKTQGRYISNTLNYIFPGIVNKRCLVAKRAF